MKKICVILIALAGIMAFTLPLCAEQTENYDKKIAEELSQIAQDVGEANGSEIAEALVGDDITVTGEQLLEMLNAKKIGGEIVEMFKNSLPDALALFGALTGTVVISAICKGMTIGMETGGLHGGIGFLSAAAMTALVLSSQYPRVDRVLNFFENISVLMNAMIPVTGAVWAMGGNVGSAGLGSATLYAMLNAVQLLCASAVTPLCAVMLMTAACSAFSEGELLEGFSSAVKKTYTFFIGLVMTVFVFVLSIQTTVAGAADTVAARSGKLLAATLIPVVGGAIGDTLRVVAGSAGYVKSVVGVGGIALIAVITLPTLIYLLTSRLAIIVSGNVAQLLGCKREAKLLGELGNVYGFLVGAVSVCAVAFTVAFGIFLGCSVAVG